MVTYRFWKVTKNSVLRRRLDFALSPMRGSNGKLVLKKKVWQHDHHDQCQRRHSFNIVGSEGIQSNKQRENGSEVEDLPNDDAKVRWINQEN